MEQPTTLSFRGIAEQVYMSQISIILYASHCLSCEKENSSEKRL